MKRVKLSIVSITSLLLLSACGGGSSNGSDTTIINDATAVASCPKKTVVKQGDKVVALEKNTEVKVLHKDNDTKTICVSKGKAKIQ